MKRYDFQPFPSLLTERLVLRDISMSDLEFLHSLRSAEENNRYIDRVVPETIEESRGQMIKLMDGVKAGEFITWVMERAADGVPVGTICLWNFDAERNSGEVGYELSPAWTGHGYMEEALIGVLIYAEEELVLDSVEAYTHSGNAPSGRLLRKNGFKKLSSVLEKSSITDVEYSLDVYSIELGLLL